MDNLESLLENLDEESYEFLEKIKDKRRKKLLNKKIDPTASYKKTLHLLNLKELHKIRKFWDFYGISDLNKDELINELSERILTNIVDWLKNLDQLNYNFINDLIKEHGLLGLKEDEVNDKTFSFIEYFQERGVIFTGKLNGEIVFYMPKEVITAVKLKLEEVDFKEIVKTNEILLNLIKGLLQYYGTMSVFKIKKEIENLTNQSIDNKRFNSLIEEATYYDPYLVELDSQLFLKRVEDKERLFKEQQKRNNLDYYQLKLDEARTAGELGHQLWNNTHKSFKSFLKNNANLKEEKANYALRVITDMIQNNVNKRTQFDYLQNEIGLELSDKVIKLLQDLQNNTHQWVLKGNTPNSFYE